MSKNPVPIIDRADALALSLFVLFVVLLLLTGCRTTKPHAAFIRMNGTRVGVSKQVAFFRPYDPNEAMHVAQDHAGITVVDSITVRHRMRAIGVAHITTVTGKP